MSTHRYIDTYHPATGEPVGWYQPGPKQVARQSISLTHSLILFLLIMAFAGGVFGGCLLFSQREEQSSTVVVCPAPGVQVAALPVECGPPTWSAVPR
ncbi:hypothetical protein AB0L82_26205 [Nocardia sp. NPDC052001]|uniref:hypothetical protein n=1 Tax=Nocardia sp. NPDC052001 TaxID=3154853 RepID=UPI003440F941